MTDAQKKINELAKRLAKTTGLDVSSVQWHGACFGQTAETYERATFGLTTPATGWLALKIDVAWEPKRGAYVTTLHHHKLDAIQSLANFPTSLVEREPKVATSDSGLPAPPDADPFE